MCNVNKYYKCSSTRLTRSKTRLSLKTGISNEVPVFLPAVNDRVDYDRFCFLNFKITENAYDFVLRSFS